MKEITLTTGQVALVDDDDYDEIARVSWTRRITGGRIYAQRSDYSTGRRVTVSMHRLIIGAKSGELVDHVNGNTLDNRRSNLRVCSNQENQMNRATSKGSTSGYKGVSWHAKNRRWRSTITLDSKLISLGCYKDPVEAAKAYDVAARQLFGEYARLNFPEGESWH